MVLFLSDLRLPQTGFSWFRSGNIKPCAAARPQKHTGRSSVPTSQEALQHFAQNYMYVVDLVKEEHHILKTGGDIVKGDSLLWSLSLQ